MSQLIRGRQALCILLASALLVACAGVPPDAPGTDANAPAAVALPQGNGTSAPAPAAAQTTIDKDALHIAFAREAELEPAMVARLQPFVARLRAEPDLQVRLTSYIPARGSRNYEMAMGEKRVKAVTASLLAQGVARRQLLIDRRYRVLPICTTRNCVPVPFVALVWETRKPGETHVRPQ